MQRATVSKQGALQFDIRVDLLFHVPWHHQGSSLAPVTWIQLPSQLSSTLTDLLIPKEAPLGPITPVSLHARKFSDKTLGVTAAGPFR
jgi:hypothetical protein